MLKKYVCLKSLCVLLNTNIEKYVTLNLKPNEELDLTTYIYKR